MNAQKPLVSIYTDGGSKPNPGPGGWAALLIYQGQQRHEKELSGNHPDTTNNRMELSAACEAFEALKQPCVVAFYTDSEYLKRGISEWMPNWIAKNWRTSARKPVKNQDLWQRLNAATQDHEIEWHWVKAHAGNEYNERVDRLATRARNQLAKK